MIRVLLNRNPVNGYVEITIYEERADGRVAVALPVNIELKLLTEEEEMNIPKPTICLNKRLGESFLTAFAEALDGEGIKTDKDAKLEGTIEATKYHLEDLRQMLKLT